MKKEEYKMTQQLLITYSQAMEQGFRNLDEFIAAINTAESVGPVVDPTLYIKGKDNLEQIKVIAKAINKARKEIQPALKVLRGNPINE